MFPTKEDVLAHALAGIQIDCGYVSIVQRKAFIDHCVKVDLIEVDQNDQFAYYAKHDFSYTCMGKKTILRIICKRELDLFVDSKKRLCSFYVIEL